MLTLGRRHIRLSLRRGRGKGGYQAASRKRLATSEGGYWGSVFQSDESTPWTLPARGHQPEVTSHVSVLFGFCRSEIFHDTQPQEKGIHMKRAAKSHTFVEPLRT